MKACLAGAIALTWLALAAGCGSSSPLQAPASAAEPQPDQAGIPQCIASGPGPAVAGPIPGVSPGDPSHNYPWLATDADLARYGYVEEEYFLCGTTPLGAYTTRILVRRPKSAAAFNGAAVVEWLNVTLGADQDLLWFLSQEHLMREGYAYVGVSAQRGGIYGSPDDSSASPLPNPFSTGTRYGMKWWSPGRYAQLEFPRGEDLDATFVFDPAAHAIFGDALRVLRVGGPANALGGLPVRQLIATGGSQSALALDVYYGFFESLHRLADGYLPFILSVSSGLAASGNDGQLNLGIPVLTEVVGKPLLLVNSESDPSFLRLPDSAHFRLWEVAGASHLGEDLSQNRRPVILRDLGIDLTENDGLCAFPPRSRIPFHYTINAALDHLRRWIADGVPPPHGPPFEYDPRGNVARDEAGNVLGGIRLSQHAVPTAVNRRENTGPGECALSGRHEPFDAATLRAMYAAHSDYVSRVIYMTEKNLRDGFVTEADARETIAAAQAAAIPPP